MSKKIVKLKRTSTKDVRAKFKFFYTEFFFNKWMSKYLLPPLNYQQQRYILKKLWGDGSVACSAISSANEELAGLIASGDIDMKENDLIFTPWSNGGLYNIYDFATKVRLINTRGVKFITDKDLVVDKEVVIIYAQKNHKSVFSSIEAKLNELIDIEMKKRASRKAQSQGWLFAFDPEDRDNAKILQEQLEDDEPYLFVPLNQPDKLKGVNNGAPYITDKVEQDRQRVFDEILTILGVQNIGVGEKKEHYVVDEVNANNQNVDLQAKAFETQLEEDFARVNEIFNKSIQVIDLNDIIEEEQEEKEPQEPEDKSDVQEY